MKRKTKDVYVTYHYVIEYEHPDHMDEIKQDLERAPGFGVRGAGVASDGKFYGFACTLTGPGKIMTGGNNDA
jgi:hypothetical protein